MSKSLIPLRPEAPIQGLSQNQQNALTWYVLSGCTRKDAILAFDRPDMAGSKSKPAFEDYLKQFFARKEVKEYLEAYQETLEKFLRPAQVKTVPTESLEERKAKAKAQATEFAITLAANIENASDPDFVLKLLDKVGILDSGEQVEEQPRRYLPVTCSECAYRKFVEENCKEVPDGTEVAGEE